MNKVLGDCQGATSSTQIETEHLEALEPPLTLSTGYIEGQTID